MSSIPTKLQANLIINRSFSGVQVQNNRIGRGKKVKLMIISRIGQVIDHTSPTKLKCNSKKNIAKILQILM